GDWLPAEAHPWVCAADVAWTARWVLATRTRDKGHPDPSRSRPNQIRGGEGSTAPHQGRVTAALFACHKGNPGPATPPREHMSDPRGFGRQRGPGPSTRRS